MVKKLKFLLINQTAWKLLFKTAVLVLFLFLIYITRSWWATALYFLAALRIYFSANLERKLFKFSFFLIIVLGLIWALTQPPLRFWLIEVLFLASLVFIILGLMDFFFRDRFLASGFLNTLLTFALLVTSFYFVNDLKWWFNLILFPALILIFNEYFNFFGLIWPSRKRLVVLVLTFAALELFWLVLFLPLGFINAAAFLTLFLLLARDGLVYFFRGRLNLAFILRELNFFIVLTIIIFVTVKWGLV